MLNSVPMCGCRNSKRLSGELGGIERQPGSNKATAASAGNSRNRSGQFSLGVIVRRNLFALRTQSERERSRGQVEFDEARGARHAGGMSKTLFEKIIAREIPAQIVFEDDLVCAFRDINPQAPTHVLIVPKKPIPRIAEAKPEDHQTLGHLLLKAAAVAEQLGLKESGYRLVFNNGAHAGEAVPHLHCHILGGRPMQWPPG